MAILGTLAFFFLVGLVSLARSRGGTVDKVVTYGPRYLGTRTTHTAAPGSKHTRRTVRLWA